MTLAVDSGWYRATMQQYTSTDRDDYMLYTENGEVNVIVGQYPNTRFYIEYDKDAPTLGTAYILRNSSDTVNYTNEFTGHDDIVWKGGNNSSGEWVNDSWTEQLTPDVTENYKYRLVRSAGASIPIHGELTSVCQFDTNIPIYRKGDTAKINHFLETGDYSEAENADEVNPAVVETTVYVDKGKPPTIKIVWNTENESPPDNCHLKIINTPIYGDVTGTPIVDKLIAFSNGTQSYSWSDLKNLSSDVKSIAIQTNFKGSIDNICTAFVKNDGSFTPSDRTNSTDNLNSIQCISGSGDDDDGYDDPDEKSEGEDTNTFTNTVGLLTNTYKLTETQIKSLGAFLWADDFMTNIKLLNNSPIENIVSVKAIPCKANTGDETTVVCGNVNTNVGATVVTSNFVKKNIGNIKINKPTNSFIDYENVKIMLYLPLIGTITDLDPIEVMGHTITLKYCFDVITGDVTAMLYNDRGGGTNLMGVYRGNCGIDIPLTASNRAQVEAGYISDAISGITSIVAKDPAGVVNAGMSALTRQNTSKSSGSVSGVTAQGLPNKAYLTVIYNTFQNYGKNFNHTYGRVCCRGVSKLKSLRGFTKVDSSIDLSSIPCTQTEKEEMRGILASGFYM